MDVSRDIFAYYGLHFIARPVLRDLKQHGMSLRGMAAELTKRRVPTPRGGTWHPQLVARVLERLAAV
jgi:hypothetical protein